MTTMLPSSVPARGLCAAVLVLAMAPAAAAQGDLPAADPALAISATAPSLAWGACPAFLPAGCELAVLHGDPAQRPMDRGFILLLFLSGATGLALLHLRDTAAMASLLAVHLGVVMALFVTLPYGKFAHATYRVAALLKWAIEKRMPTNLKLKAD